jgi:ZIP family zinc transporter
MSFDFSSIPWIGAFASLVAGSATVLGALGVFVMPKKSPLLEDVFMSFAAGIMLAASFFSLILTGLEAAKDSGFSDLMGVSTVIFGILAGASFIWILNYFIPHEHFNMGKEGVMDSLKLKRIWLFVIAIAIHNFPEGMAVGVGFAGNNTANGTSLALGIALQNVPEGFAVAVALLAVGYSRLFSFGIASITGLLEPLGGLVGVLTLGVSQNFYPFILGFAGGAMLFIISDEIIPETHQKTHATVSTFSLLIGFVLMMFFDVLFG